MIREEPYWVYFLSVSTSHCPPFVESTDTLNLGIYVVEPDDIPSDDAIIPVIEDIETSIIPYPDPDSLNAFILFVNDTVHCLDIIHEDVNLFDTLALSLDTSSEIFGFANAPTFNDTSQYHPPGAPQTPIEINQQFCWQPECKDVRAEPYTIDFRFETKSCDVKQDEIIPVDLYVRTISDGSLQLVPNVFTPNTDDSNPRWKLKHIDDVCRVDKDIRVWNRWGTEVYFSGNLLEEWPGTYNGNSLSDGEYFYVIKYNFLGESFLYKGGVTIMK